MKLNKGIKATGNYYAISGFALVDGKPRPFEDTSDTRDKRADTKRIADALGVKPSAVMLEYATIKRTISIDCDMNALIAALDAAGIAHSEA